MNPNIIIRPATLADNTTVFTLAKAMATSFEVEKEHFDQSFCEIVDEDSSTCIVAELEGELIGYLIGFDHRAFYANGRVSWVEEIFVRKLLRKKGIGKSLMDSFEEWCRARRSKLIALATRRASDFYETIGYEESATFYRKVLEQSNQ